jgi:hypothetical protein
MSDSWQAFDRPQVFEPALRHLPRAFRAGDPVFADARLQEAWYVARRNAMEFMLRIVADSKWGGNLVLRGSLLLKAWLGDAGREPGDIDWVVGPATTALTSSWSAELFSGLLRLFQEHPHSPLVEFDVDSVRTSDIWTYERAPGRRAVIPWRAPRVPPGEVQMDFVFGEEMWDAPIQSDLLTSDGRRITVLSASKEQSLAWKILWLDSDIHPQGKDLYDATLLAEQTVLPMALLRRALAHDCDTADSAASPQLPLDWHVDWPNFQAEYPWIQGSVMDWQERLTRALKPTFSAEQM